ncbi:murein L,D-transpeptidase [Streptomyces sp. T1317-0309]|nr:murein L,D-transpeptidase [Streptomyces sp. T1317-0309]
MEPRRGRTDISHGCIHLNTPDARRFYDFSGSATR